MQKGEKMRNPKLTRCIIAIVFTIVFITSAFVIFLPREGKKVADDIWVDTTSFDIKNIQTMKKTNGKDFVILAITDLQFDVPTKSKKQVKEDIQKMIDSAKPDLIVTVGDNFAGIFNHFHVEAFVKLMDSFELPWAPVFGNHERDFGADLNYLAEVMARSKYCMFRSGPTNIDGVGNYFVNIEEDSKLVYSLALLDCNEEIFVKDSKGKRVNAYYESPRYSQVRWYKDNIQMLCQSAGKTIPSLLFTHVPIPQFKQAYELYEAGNNEVEFLHGEGKAYGGLIEYGLFDAALALGSTKHMFFGHDHEDTIALKYKGITLAYVPKTGNFSSHVEGKTGGKIIKLKDAGKIDFESIFASTL